MYLLPFDIVNQSEIKGQPVHKQRRCKERQKQPVKPAKKQCRRKILFQIYILELEAKKLTLKDIRTKQCIQAGVLFDNKHSL